jgi:CheY-like chemotaxis protein
MALAHAIAEHLPYLRRYARALCGTQKSGDAYVRAALETIVADPTVIGSDTTPRVALYRLFHKLWGSANVDLRPVSGSRPQQAAAGVEKKLGELTPARRQALLLTAMEDEPIISLDLQSIVREMGHTVAAIATTRDEAVRAARKTEPGLVLADIKLADGSSGIDAVRQILSEVQVPIVFITAYPERLLTGERPEPTFLVTKPFVPETVRVAVSQALLFT